MLLIPYFTEASISPEVPGKILALVHPGGSQVGSLFFRGLDVLGSPGGPVRLRLSRHPSKATNGTASTAYSFLDGAPSSFAQVLWGDVAWPVDTPTFVAAAFAETRSAGGGIVVPTQNASAGALTIGPDHTLVVETLDPDKRGNYMLRIFWGEQISGIPILVASTLPAYPSYSAATYFNVPLGWTTVTFVVTYTAHASSSGGGVAWRGVMSADGTNAIPLPVIDTTLDVSAAPVARRTVYQHEDRWPSSIAMGQTVRFMVSFDVPPGMPKVRLDLAETGDATNRGTATVLITGG